MIVNQERHGMAGPAIHPQSLNYAIRLRQAQRDLAKLRNDGVTELTYKHADWSDRTTGNFWRPFRAHRRTMIRKHQALQNKVRDDLAPLAILEAEGRLPASVRKKAAPMETKLHQLVQKCARWANRSLRSNGGKRNTYASDLAKQSARRAQWNSNHALANSVRILRRPIVSAKDAIPLNETSLFIAEYNALLNKTLQDKSALARSSTAGSLSTEERNSYFGIDLPAVERMNEQLYTQYHNFVSDGTAQLKIAALPNGPLKTRYQTQIKLLARAKGRYPYWLTTLGIGIPA